MSSSPRTGASADRAVLLAACVLLLWHLLPLLSASPLAGWDLTPHYYLVEKMAELIRSGRLSGYDPNWYGGYPLFVLYPPLFYIVVAGTHLLSFELIPLALCFNLCLFIIPLALLFSLRFAARRCFGAEAAIAVPIFALLFLTLPAAYAHFSVGLLGMVAIGMPASFAALVLLALIIGMLEHAAQQGQSRGQTVTLGLLIAAVILTHTVIALFTAWTLVFYFLFRPQLPRARVLIAGFLGLVLASWWWAPFLASLPYSSATTLGLPGWMADPLRLLFPGFIEIKASNFYPVRSIFFHPQVPLLGQVTFAVPNFIVHFPYTAVLFSLCVGMGLVSLLRSRNIFFPALYLVTLLIVPRNLLTDLPLTGLHTYRFIQPLYVLHILVAAYGLYALYALVRARQSRVTASLLSGSLTALCGLAVLFGSLVHFRMEPSPPPSLSRDAKRARDFTYKFSPSEYPYAQRAAKLLSFIRENPPKGRIAVDTAESLFHSLGSPHFFSTHIPAKLGLPVIPGLLAESALSAGFINSTMYGLSNIEAFSRSLLWGRRWLADFDSFKYLPPESKIARLQRYGVEYVLTALPERKAVLAESPAAQALYDDGVFQIFRLREFSPLALSGPFAPFLFVERGGTTFREFSELLYCHDDLIDHPVIFLPKGEGAVPASERERIGGYIVSWGAGKIFDQAEYTYWAAKKKPVIVLNASAVEVETTSADIHFVTDYGPWSGYLRFESLMLELLEPAHGASVTVKSNPEFSELAFESRESVLLNYSYHPRWKSSDPTQEVYWAAPSKMFVFGSGANSLHFD